jgi:hypothetical protein
VVLVVAVGVWALTRPGNSDGTLQSAGATQKPETPIKPIASPAAETTPGKVLATNAPREPEAAPKEPPPKDSPVFELKQGATQPSGASAQQPTTGQAPQTPGNQAGKPALGNTPGAGSPSATPCCSACGDQHTYPPSRPACRGLSAYRPGRTAAHPDRGSAEAERRRIGHRPERCTAVHLRMRG